MRWRYTRRGRTSHCLAGRSAQCTVSGRPRSSPELQNRLGAFRIGTDFSGRHFEASFVGFEIPFSGCEPSAAGHEPWEACFQGPERILELARWRPELRKWKTKLQNGHRSFRVANEASQPERKRCQPAGRACERGLKLRCGSDRSVSGRNALRAFWHGFQTHRTPSRDEAFFLSPSPDRSGATLWAAHDGLAKANTGDRLAPKRCPRLR